MILLNGLRSELCAGETVASVLAHLQIEREAAGVAVAVDGEVIARSAWADFELPDGARVEILVAMQGG